VLEAGQRLAEEGSSVRVVSFPCWELFKSTPESYRESVLPGAVKKRLAVEMGIGAGWEKWVGDGGEIISIEGYGASAPYKILMEKYGYTVENVYQRARKILG